MQFIQIDSQSFIQLKKQLDRIEKELKFLRDPTRVLASEWLSVDDVAQILRVSRRTMYNYLSTGLIPNTKIQSSRFFHIDDVRDFMRRRNGGMISPNEEKLLRRRDVNVPRKSNSKSSELR